MLMRPNRTSSSHPACKATIIFPSRKRIIVAEHPLSAGHAPAEARLASYKTDTNNVLFAFPPTRVTLHRGVTRVGGNAHKHGSSRFLSLASHATTEASSMESGIV